MKTFLKQTNKQTILEYFKNNFNFKNYLPKIATVVLPIFLCVAAITFASTVGTNITTVNINATGDSTTDGDATITGALDLTGLATFLSGLNVTGALGVTGNTTLTGDLLVTGDVVGSFNTGATLIVCAADRKSDKWKCDYTTDGDGGVSDTTTIQTAVAALPAGGGKVLLTEGSFYLTDGNNCPTSFTGGPCGLTFDGINNITLSGVGPATILTADSATAAIGILNGIGIDGDNVIMENFTIDGATSKISTAIEVRSSSNPMIRNLSITGIGTDGIVFNDVNNGTIQGNYFYDNYADYGGNPSEMMDIEEGSVNALLVNNTVVNSTKCAIFHIHDFGTESVKNVQFVENRCVGGANANSWLETYVNAGYELEVSIVGNVFTGGAYIKGADTSAVTNSYYTLSIINNLFDTSEYHAIFIGADGSGNTSTVNISNNYFTNITSSYNAIYAFNYEDKLVVKGNIISTAGGAGILTNSINGTSDLIIKDNHIAGTTNEGIYIGTAGTALISGNYVAGKDIRDALTADSGQVTISDNIVDGGMIRFTGTAGINTFSSVGGNTINCPVSAQYCIPTVGRAEVIGNQIIGGGTAGAGIQLVSPYSIAEGNTIHETEENGITVSSTCSRCIIANNIITDTGNESSADYDSGIDISGSNVLVTGNVIHDSQGTKTMFNPIKLQTASNGALIANNEIGSSQGGVISLVSPTNYSIRNNRGYVTEAEGSASIDCGDTVTHGLSGTPDYVFVTLGGDSNPTNIYVDSRDSATFAIQCTDTGDNSYVFFWRAVFIP